MSEGTSPDTLPFRKWKYAHQIEDAIQIKKLDKYAIKGGSVSIESIYIYHF